VFLECEKECGILGFGFLEVRKVKGEHVLAWWYGLCACEAIYNNNMTLI